MPDPKTISVPEPGRIYFHLGRNASHAAVARGEIPMIPDRVPPLGSRSARYCDHPRGNDRRGQISQSR